MQHIEIEKESLVNEISSCGMLRYFQLRFLCCFVIWQSRSSASPQLSTDVFTSPCTFLVDPSAALDLPPPLPPINLFLLPPSVSPQYSPRLPPPSINPIPIQAWNPSPNPNLYPRPQASPTPRPNLSPTPYPSPRPNPTLSPTLIPSPYPSPRSNPTPSFTLNPTPYPSARPSTTPSLIPSPSPYPSRPNPTPSSTQKPSPFPSPQLNPTPNPIPSPIPYPRPQTSPAPSPFPSLKPQPSLGIPYPSPGFSSYPAPNSYPASSPGVSGCGTTLGTGLCGAFIPSFTYSPATNYIGGDILKNLTGSASSSCGLQCLLIPTCTIFSKNISSGACYFKNSSAIANSTAGFESWKICQTSIYSPSIAPNTPARPVGRRLLNSPQSISYWSDPSTWPNGVVPGIGMAVGINATIPCGQFVVLDVPNITLGLLRIQGLLQFLDDPRVPRIYVKANFVLVEGQLIIGSFSQQYHQKAVIELTPNTVFNRSPLRYIGPAPPADPANPRNLGHKAFAVVGGQVSLHGLPGPPEMPVWVRLGKDANIGDRVIQVAADLSSSWPIGSQIVITSSDYERSQTETFTILNVTSIGRGQSIISLDKPLVYGHYGTFNGLSDSYGGFVDERAEVMLISRNIRITGTDEPAPYDREGGHFIVYMTRYPPQYIEGVEFYKMGQQGNLGRYSLHFHILGAVPGTVCRKNSIHQSKQRCIVTHASHNITYDSNVAFNTSGHCFVLEEGGEQNNTWINNIGAQTNPVTVLISSDESDDQPSTFWITNLLNVFIGNVGAGAGDSSFWFQLRLNVRGDSLSIPELMNLQPISDTLRLFLNNTAHSNDVVGLRTYPNGMRPRLANGFLYGVTSILDGVKSYKNVGIGMFVHKSDNMLVNNSAFADNGWGVHLSQSELTSVANSVLVALTNNYGNPSKCTDPLWQDCQAIDPHICAVPLNATTPGRSTGWRTRDVPVFGIVFDQGEISTHYPNSLSNIKFAGYDNYCNEAAAITMIGVRPAWNPGLNTAGLKFTSNTNPVWVPPRRAHLYEWGGLTDNGEQEIFGSFFDTDGSLNGGVPGYLLANTTQILPPGMAGCTAHPPWNAYTCSNVCYRSVWIYYPEFGFGTNPSNVNNTHGSFSYLKVTRASDGQQLILDGNLQDPFPSPVGRNYVMTLLANQTYNIEVVPSGFAPSFLAENMTIQLADSGICSQGITFRFFQTPEKPWTINPSNYVGYKQCPGITPIPQSAVNAQFWPVCVNNQTWLEVIISGGFNNISIGPVNRFPQVSLNRNVSSDEGVCQASVNCSAIWSHSPWLYDDSGLERKPAFFNPILSQPKNWQSGITRIGNAPWWAEISTTVNSPNTTMLLTYYYRTTFNLSYASCYSALLVDAIVMDAIVLYVNNVEAFRTNLPPGPLTNATPALIQRPWFNWQNFTVLLNQSSSLFLVDGINTIAVEHHMYYSPWDPIFEMRVTPVYTLGCTKAQIPRNETCNGLDDNLDGFIDNSVTGGPLTIPCSTPCGKGVMTCINGYYQNCTAVVPTVEICDGLDNNCDGTIDNGMNELDCANGLVCWKGSCMRALNATLPVQIWPRNSTGWAYQNASLNPTTQPWGEGRAPFGNDPRNPVPSWQIINTNITSTMGTVFTTYFSKGFVLTSSQINSTFNIDFSVRRVDGVVVYLNGVELWRDNMNWGAVLPTTPSAGRVVGQAVETAFYNCRNCRRNNSNLLKIGTNVIKAELHTELSSWDTLASFDMDLYRNAIAPCPNTPSACFRGLSFQIIPSGSTWMYLDGSFPPPATSSWKDLNYNASQWLSGVAPLGYNMWGPATSINNGSVNGSALVTTLYFRLVVNISDASCFATLTANLWGKDGVVVYINGVEAYRINMPAGLVNSTTNASGSTWGYYPPVNFTGSWLTPGMNVFAAEVHRLSSSNNQCFDLTLSGWRESVVCSPNPTNYMVPWMNGY